VEAELCLCLETGVEVTAKDPPEKSAKMGWVPRHDPTILIPRGIVRDIAFKSKGETWLLLDWKPPIDGGAATADQIERRKAGGRAGEDEPSALAAVTL